MTAEADEIKNRIGKTLKEFTLILDCHLQVIQHVVNPVEIMWEERGEMGCAVRDERIKTSRAQAMHCFSQQVWPVRGSCLDREVGYEGGKFQLDELS